MLTEEQYLLTCLAEECVEVAQRADKAIRFGLGEVQPGQPLTNLFRLEEELNDLLGVVTMLGLRTNYEAMIAKQHRVREYMGYSRKLGIVEPKRSQLELFPGVD